MVKAVNADGGSAAVLAQQAAATQNAQQARNAGKQQSHAAAFNQEILKNTQPANSVVTTTATAAPSPASTSNATSDKFAPGPRTGQDAGKFEIRVKDTQSRPANGEASTASQAAEGRLYKSVPLKFGDRLDKTFDSVDTATAQARSVGENGAAVVAEGDHYAVYKLQETGFWQPDFNIKSVASDGLLIKNDVVGSEGVKMMVTKDGYVVDLSSGQSHVELSGASNDPFSAHQKAFGEGLAGLHGDRAQFEKHFERVMRDAAFTALDQSETATKTAMQGLSSDASLEKPTEQFTDADRAAIDKAKTQMAPIDEKIIAKKQELDAARKELEQAEGQLRAGVGLYNSLFGPKRTLSPGEAWDRSEKAKNTVQQMEAELNGLNAARVQAAQDYPLLLRVEPEKMREFNAKSESDQVKFLHKEAKDVLGDIKTTRANLKNGEFNLWTMPGLRNTTAAGLGIKGEQLKWIEERAQQEQNTETAWKIGEATFAIGFAVGGAFFTGGTSLLLLGTSAAIGVYGAVDTTQEYFRNNAATNTNLDPSAGLLPADMKQHWGWVAAAWIGVGLDVGMVTSTVRALRAGKISMEAAAKSLGTDVKTLRATLDTAKASKLEVKTLDASEFTAKYGDDVQAVTLLREGKDGRLTVEVVSNKALSASERSKALAEEFAHLKQLNDPAIREKMLKLTEKRLAGWKAMSASDKRDLIHTKLEVEADAQKILLKEGGPNVDKAMAQEHLANIEAKLGELDEAAKSGRVPEWVEHADAPRLFSKELKYDQASLTSLKDVNSKLLRDGVSKKLGNPGLEADELLVAAEILSRRGALPADAQGHILGEDRIVERFFGRNPKKSEGIPAVEGLLLNRNGKLTAFEVKNQNVPDVDHALRKFCALFDDSKFSSALDANAVTARKLSIGRLDLYIPSGTKPGAGGVLDGYSVNNQGLLTKIDNGVEKVVRIGPKQLSVHVIRRNLPQK